MTRPLAAFVVWCALSVPASVYGQEVVPPQPAQPPLERQDPAFSGFTFIMENDVLWQLGHNEDRNYTGGFGFLFAGDFVRQWKLAAPLHGLDSLTRFDRLFKDPRPFHSALVFGTGFTPDALNIREPVLDDRPYASIVGLSIRRVVLNDANQQEAWSSDLSAGFMGLHTARNLQRWLHKRLRKNETKLTPYDPVGWPNQISEAGELTAMYRVGYERGMAGTGFGPHIRKRWQVSVGGQGSVGYYTNVVATSAARVGAFNTDFWQFTPGAMSIATQKAGPDLPRWEAYLFGGARPRLVLYNALLQGQFKDSIYTADPKRLLLEWDLGAVVSYGGFAVIWNAYAGRTSEFQTPDSRTHTWGSIQAGYTVR